MRWIVLVVLTSLGLGLLSWSFESAWRSVLPTLHTELYRDRALLLFPFSIVLLVLGPLAFLVAGRRGPGMRPNVLLAAGLVLYGLAWFLPVARHGVTFPEGLPGWEAFVLALSPLWSSDESTRWYGVALAVTSAATNGLVLVPLFAWRARRNVRVMRVLGWAFLASILVNAQWLLWDDPSDLRIGYFVWWLSFAVIGVACLVRGRSSVDGEKLEATV